MPRSATTLIGRDDVVALLDELLGEGHPLITIVGPPGVGKTAVALALIAGVTEHEDLRVARCDVADAHDEAALLVVVAHALGVDGAGDRLLAALSELPTLLLLDNFEQLVRPARALIAAWLEQVPELQLLVTSRERLGFSAERVFELAPLKLPQPDDPQPERSPAVQLYLQRAREAEPNQSLADLTAIARLVRELDGLPLALELAAARSDVLSPEQLLARLDEPRPERGRRPADLHAAMDISWELLSDTERRVLGDASVFRGGFTAEAIEGSIDVSGLPGVPVTLDVVQSLRRKSLLTPQWSGAPERRLGLLLTVRRYVGDRLRESGRQLQAERSHAEYFASFADRQLSVLAGPGGGAALRTLDADYDNFIVAVDGCLATSDTDSLACALRILCPLYTLASMSDRRAAVRDRFERACNGAAFPGIDPRLQTDALVLLSALLYFAGRFDRSLEVAERAGQIAQEQRLELWRAKACWRISAALGRLGRRDDALRVAHEGLMAARASGNLLFEALVCEEMAAAHSFAGDAGEALRHIQRSVELLRSEGHHIELLSPLMTQAFVLIEASKLDLARQSAFEALALYDQLALSRGERGVVLEVLLARIAHGQGELGEARARYQTAARLGAAIGSSFGLYAKGYRALVDDELAASSQAWSDLAATLPHLHESDRYRPFLSAAWGAMEARLGSIEPAEAKIEAAIAALEARGGHLHQAAEACRGVIDAARAARLAPSDPIKAATLRERASQRLRQLQSAAAPALELAIVARMLQRALADENVPQRAADTLLVDGDGRWFERYDHRVHCGGRPVMRRMLLAFVEAHLAHRGRTLSRDELIAAGWPGQRILEHAARRRLDVMVSRMRDAGLQGILQTHEGGYRIAPDVEVTLDREA